MISYLEYAEIFSFVSLILVESKLLILIPEDANAC